LSYFVDRLAHYFVNKKVGQGLDAQYIYIVSLVLTINDEVINIFLQVIDLLTTMN